ncbi:MAG: hypothetical protein NVSMB25_26040 [Thermoleophilaceae bacterium]
MPPPTLKPARLTAAERRDQLLDVTKAIAVRRGFHSVSIEAVAREAGISRPIVYGHFGDLAGLLEALVTRESERALAQLAEVLPRAPSRGNPSGPLLAALEGYLRAARTDPDTWRLVLMPPEGAPDILRKQIAEGRAAVIDRLAALAATGPASPDPELTARAISAVADEAVRLVLSDPEHYSAERVMAHAEWMLNQLSGTSRSKGPRS